MPSTVEAECPKCGLKVSTVDEISERFGWRWVPNKRDENRKRIPQSHCHQCRRSAKYSKIGKGNR